MLIPTKKNVKTITDMRENALGLLDEIDKEGLAYIFHRSQPRAVLIDIDTFISLQQILEEYQDYKDIEKLSKEKRGKGIPLDKVAKDYV